MPVLRLLRFALAPAIAASLISAPAALASAGSIVIDGISAPSAETGLLSVQAEATTPITSLTVDINGTGGLALALTTSDFTQTSGGPTDGIWTVTSPIDPAVLPYGVYQVAVSAADSGGDSISNFAAGTYVYLLHPMVTLRASPASLNYYQQVVTLSGTATVVYPDGSSGPLQNWPVTIFSSSGGSWSSRSDASGAFTLSVDQSALQDTYSASVTGAGMGNANSSSVAVNGQPWPVELTATLSSSYVAYGQPVTLSGVATYEAGGVWLPLHGVTVSVTGAYMSNNPVPGTLHAVTDGNGKYSVRLPATATAMWTATIASTQYLQFVQAQGNIYQPLGNMVTLTVRMPTQIGSDHTTYTPLGDVTISGCLKVPPADNGDNLVPSDMNLSVQYASRPAGPWRTIAYQGATPSQSGCPGGQALSFLAYSGRLSGYYRIHYGGNYLYQPSAGPPAYAATLPTRIKGFSVSPASVNGHGQITFTGTLQQHKSGWQGLGHVVVYLLIRPPGYSGWAGWYRKMKTSASGSFRFSFADPVTASWAVLYAGDSGHLASLSGTIHVVASGTTARLLPGLDHFGQLPIRLAGPELPLPVGVAGWAAP